MRGPDTSALHRAPRTALLPALLVTTALATPAMPSAAWAADTNAAGEQVAQIAPMHDFAIPAQDLSDALPLFGQQAGVQTSAPGAALRGLRTSGVSGTLTTQAAIERLLTGTGLTYRFNANGSITIVDPVGSDLSGLTLDPVRVEGYSVTSGTFSSAAEAAGGIAVTREDLERRNPGTIKDVFSGQSGVSVGGAVPLSQKVYVNGIEETNLAVQIDGARQNNKVFHHSGTNLIDPSLLKAVRVDPSVAPADAGPGALAAPFDMKPSMSMMSWPPTGRWVASSQAAMPPTARQPPSAVRDTAVETVSRS